MRAFLWNIFLAFTWAFASGELTTANLFIGFVCGYLILGFCQNVVGESNYYKKFGQVLSFAVYVAWQILLSNLRVAYDVITPSYFMRPGIVAIPLDAETPEEITLLANLITLTPGSLSLDISADRKTLYVHMMYIDDIDKEREKIKQGFERRVLEVLR